MLQKIKSNPVWYQAWAISVAIGAVYILVKYFMFELSSADRLVNVYVLVSILIDYFFFPTASKS